MTAASGLRARIARGENVLGTFVLEFASPGIGRLVASAGADFVVFDAEHTGWGWETLAALTTSTRPSTADVVIRVPRAERSYISRALDVGAHGVMVPMVSSAAEAEEIVQAAKHPPRGRRGAVFGLAQDDYLPVDPAAAMATRNAETLLIAQIETTDGLEQVERIAAVDGIDVLWVGHLDLTADMGIVGDYTAPAYTAALDRVAAAARAHGKAAGFLDLDGTKAGELGARGYSVLGVGGDAWLYQRALAGALTAARQAADLQERKENHP